MDKLTFNHELFVKAQDEYLRELNEYLTWKGKTKIITDEELNKLIEKYLGDNE